MKRIYLAAVFAIFSTAAPAQLVKCDLVGEGEFLRLMRHNELAFLLFNSQRVDLQAVHMWCGGNSCVNLETVRGRGIEVGQMLLNGPILPFDIEGTPLGEPYYELWNRGSDNPIKLRCAE